MKYFDEYCEIKPPDVLQKNPGIQGSTVANDRNQIRCIFYLQDYVSPKEVAASTDYNERNLCLFLNSLAAIGLLDMQNGEYGNRPAANEYLNRNRDTYLGDYILFMERMTGLENVEKG